MDTHLLFVFERGAFLRFQRFTGPGHAVIDARTPRGCARVASDKDAPTATTACGVLHFVVFSMTPFHVSCTQLLSFALRRHPPSRHPLAREV